MCLLNHLHVCFAPCRWINSQFQIKELLNSFISMFKDYWQDILLAIVMRGRELGFHMCHCQFCPPPKPNYASSLTHQPHFPLTRCPFCPPFILSTPSLISSTQRSFPLPILHVFKKHTNNIPQEHSTLT